MADQTQTQPVLIYGVDDIFAVQLVDSLRRSGVEIAGGILLGDPKWELKGVPALLQHDEITDRHRRMPCIVPHNGSTIRRRNVEAARKDGFSQFPTHVDTTALVSDMALIGRGCFIDNMANVGGAVQLDEFVTISRSSLVGHHSVVEDFVTIAPNTIITSSAHLCEGCYIGAGTSSRPGIRVGKGAIVGAGSVLVKDVEPYTVVAGNPARYLRDTKLRPKQGAAPEPASRAAG